MPDTLNKVRKTQMGATMPMWAPIKTDVTGSLPTYDAALDFSEFVKVSENLNVAETQYYSNDALSENVSEFKYCELTYDNKGLTDELISAIYGADYSDGEVTYGGDDAPPMGGFGFYRTVMDKGVKYYEGVFYPKVKASLGNSTYDTKGENVTLVGDSTKLIAYQCTDEKKSWKKTQVFATAAEALAWVKEKFGTAGA